MIGCWRAERGESAHACISSDWCILAFPTPLIQATWNMSMLQTQDIIKSVQAAMEKKDTKSITFSKL